MKNSLLLITASFFFTIASLTSCSNLTPQDRQARATVKAVFKQSLEGDSYKPIAWGRVETDSFYAGTGTENFLFGKTSTLPSKYSITHRLKMRNGLGMLITYDVRIFFTDEHCTRWTGMEYMDQDDPTRYLMEKEKWYDKIL